MLLLSGVLILLPMAWIVGCSSGTPLARQRVLTSSAENYLRDLGAPIGASSLTDLRIHERDGLQNEEASGSYRVPLPGSSVLEYYRVACRRLGLQSPASADTKTYNPAALCDGVMIVTVAPQCNTKGCNVFVKVTG